MNRPRPDRLYDLLPATYRFRDYWEREPLRAFMSVLERQFTALEQDLDGLYEDWFIETCQEPLIPYIGDLIGASDLIGPDDIGSDGTAIRTLRSLVGNLISYRRRKGTAVALERVARDATGWPARVVEFRDRLSTTQHLRDLRPTAGRLVNLRDLADLDRGTTPFDTMSHTAAIRPSRGEEREADVQASPIGGTYSVNSVGLYLWRLESYPMEQAAPREVAPGCYTVHPFGLDMPLFNQPSLERGAGDRTAVRDVPEALSARALRDELEARGRRLPPATDYLGTAPCIAISTMGPDGARHHVGGDRLAIADLSHWKPVADRVAIDPKRGRIRFPSGETPTGVRVSYSYGFSADVGGGPYVRRSANADASDRDEGYTVRLVQPGDESADAVLAELWRHVSTREGHGRVVIADSGLYALPAGSRLALDDRALTIEAEEGQCPTLRGDLEIVTTTSATVTLKGVRLDGTLRLSGRIALRLEHCTIAPPRRGDASPAAAIAAGAQDPVNATIAHCLVGPLRLGSLAMLAVQDSVVDGGPGRAIAGTGQDDRGPATAIEGCTVFGEVRVAQLMLACDTLFTGPLFVHDQTTGCLRFCYVPDGSLTPPAYRCIPDVTSGRAWVAPTFTSTHYGDPGYAQLGLTTSPYISQGASDGGEMGVFHGTAARTRRRLLAGVLADCVPFGLNTHVIFVN